MWFPLCEVDISNFVGKVCDLFRYMYVIYNNIHIYLSKEYIYIYIFVHIYALLLPFFLLYFLLYFY